MNAQLIGSSINHIHDFLMYYNKPRSNTLFSCPFCFIYVKFVSFLRVFTNAEKAKHKNKSNMVKNKNYIKPYSPYIME